MIVIIYFIILLIIIICSCCKYITVINNINEDIYLYSDVPTLLSAEELRKRIHNRKYKFNDKYKYIKNNNEIK